MPAPSIVSAQDINNEVGNSSTAQVALNDTRPRNLANKTGGSTTISYGDCRWGINFRGGQAFSNRFDKVYNTTPNLEAYATDFPPRPTLATATCILRFRANGQMSIFVNEQGQGLGLESNSTWLTSGAAGDYTVQVTVSSGSWDSGTTGTDLAMSSDRVWELERSTNSNYVTAGVAGNIIIKDSGGTLITRPYVFDVQAESVL